AAFVLSVRKQTAAGGVALALATLTKQTAALALLPLGYLAWRTRRGRGLIVLGAAFVVPIFIVAVAFGPRDLAHWVFTGNGAYVQQHTPPRARVLVWGQAPEVYWASARRPATRFATTGFVTGVSGGRPASRVGTQYAAPGATDLFYGDLRRTPPVLVADMSTA